MESAHTPEPWVIVTYGDGDSLVIHSGEHERVCFMATPGDSPGAMERIEAHANLICAAPDLLSVCVELMPKGISPANGNVPDSTVIPVDITMGELRRLASAIAKAQGPQSPGESSREAMQDGAGPGRPLSDGGR